MMQTRVFSFFTFLSTTEVGDMPIHVACHAAVAVEGCSRGSILKMIINIFCKHLLFFSWLLKIPGVDSIFYAQQHERASDD